MLGNRQNDRQDSKKTEKQTYQEIDRTTDRDKIVNRLNNRQDRKQAERQTRQEIDRTTDKIGNRQGCQSVLIKMNAKKLCWSDLTQSNQVCHVSDVEQKGYVLKGMS